MLDLRKAKIRRVELIEFRQQRYQQIRDILLELEQADALMHDKSILLTAEEAAERLRCEVRLIPRSIPRVKVGAKRHFQLGDIEDFIATHKR